MAPTLAPSGGTLAALGDRQMIAGMTSASVMTIGRLSRRTGVPVKVLREYEDMGLIYTVGRSAGNYRLFDEDALWCVGVVSGLRTLGLTLSEIQELASNYLAHPGGPVGQRLAGVLKVVRARTERRLAELQELLGRLDEFEVAAAAELAGQTDFRAQDPRFQRDRLDSAPGGRP
jgi:MerR family copper efflux transcriptional regulator